MAHVRLRRTAARRGGVWAGTCAALLCGLPAAFAQPAPAVAASPPVAPAPAEPGGHRSYTQSALTKVRPGSLLRFDRQVAAAVPPGRTRLAARGDDEQQRHFTRVGELDVVFELAERARDLGLLERVEQARRNEQQRYFGAMQALRRAVAQQPAGAGAALVAAPPPPLGTMYRRAVEQARRAMTPQNVAAELSRIEVHIEREREREDAP